MAYKRSGLGAYPTDAYYDPGRPDWLPYWIDDPTESQNKIAYLASLGGGGPVAVVVGTQGAQLAAAAAPLIATTPGVSPYVLPPAPATVQPPSMLTDPTGQGVSIDSQIAAQSATQTAALQQWAVTQAGATPVDNTSAGALLNALAAGSSLAGLPNWVMLAGVGVLLFVGVKIAGGR